MFVSLSRSFSRSDSGGGGCRHWRVASICDGEQNARAKRNMLARTTRRKRFVNEERERIAARATRREKPYADSSRGRTRERNRKRQRPVRRSFWRIRNEHDARQPEMRKDYHAHVYCGPYIEFVIRMIKTFANHDERFLYATGERYLKQQPDTVDVIRDLRRAQI